MNNTTIWTENFTSTNYIESNNNLVMLLLAKIYYRHRGAGQGLSEEIKADVLFCFPRNV